MTFAMGGVPHAGPQQFPKSPKPKTKLPPVTCSASGQQWKRSESPQAQHTDSAAEKPPGSSQGSARTFSAYFLPAFREKHQYQVAHVTSVLVRQQFEREEKGTRTLTVMK